jgi:hypothetical protein
MAGVMPVLYARLESIVSIGCTIASMTSSVCVCVGGGGGVTATVPPRVDCFFEHWLHDGINVVEDDGGGWGVSATAPPRGKSGVFLFKQLAL